MNDYRSIYQHVVSGAKVRVKRVTGLEYVALNSLGEKLFLSVHHLRKEFKFIGKFNAETFSWE